MYFVQQFGINNLKTVTFSQKNVPKTPFYDFPTPDNSSSVLLTVMAQSIPHTKTRVLSKTWSYVVQPSQIPACEYQ